MISLSVSIGEPTAFGRAPPYVSQAPGVSRRAGMDRANGLVLAAHGPFVRLMFYNDPTNG
jgi:hypothetical protein